MNEQLKRKLAKYDWDLDEIRSVMGDVFTNNIYDCDIDYIYYHPAAFEKGRMDVEGHLEVWYENHWIGNEEELPEV